MNRDLNILHITDLHLDEPKKSNEHLREGNYKEFIDRLVDEINIAMNSEPIHCIIFTGDFVHRGKVYNFPHAAKIVDYLVLKLKLNKNNIGVCIGNHDYIQDFDKTSSGEIYARDEFISFAKKYSHKNTLYSNSRAIIKNLTEDITFISLDSTLGSKGENKPGSFEVKEADAIINAIKEDSIVPSGNLLIVASHYPLENFPAQTYYSEEKFDSNKHFWSSASYFRKQVSVLSASMDEKTLWLFGDTHVSAKEAYDLQYFVMTGRFGTSTDSNHSQRPREARIISFKQNGKVYSHQFYFNMPNHDDNPQEGKWSHDGKKNFPTVSKLEVRKVEKLVEKKAAKKSSPKNKINKLKTDFSRDIEIIDLDIENKIKEIVSNNQLYKFGKFITSPDEISLGWISINQLLSDNILLPQFILKSQYWLNRITEKSKDKIKFENTNSVIIGIDFWGTIMSSLLSVQTNISNLCISSKADGQLNATIKGVLEKDIKKLFSKFENIIFISDVVSSGRTIKSIYGYLDSILDSKNFNWYSISIISDAKSDRKDNLKFLKAIGTFCGSIRIPVVKKEFLPEDEILSPNLDNSKLI